ncbi:MAG: cytochrome P450 [Beijerinckiaceae bacterium]|nr:cytochrome P450 [Beijerinckiaceae bacterium]
MSAPSIEAGRDPAPRTSTRPFTPWAPPPRRQPAGSLMQLWHLARNPIESWANVHYEEPILAGPSMLGHLVVVSDPAAIRRVFVDNVANYEKDPLQLRVLRSGAPEGSGEGLLSASGDAWRRTRRTLSPLFTPRRVGAFAQIMRLKSDARVDSWLKRRPGTIVEIDREMVRLTLDILSSTLFSDALDEDRPGFEREMMKLLDAIGRIDPLDVLNAPNWMPRLNRRSAQQSREWFAATSERLIAQRIAEMARAPDRAPDDLLTALLRASDPETGIGLSHEEVAANLFTFIAAGHETTARALAWTLHLLSRAPEWQERVRAEAINAPDDPADWPDAMPATRAVFEEAMRLFPPVPHMSRMALEADRLGEINVPAKAIIIVAPWLLHRHKRLWTQPGAFMPERFLPGAREKIDRFAYLPFGAGPRVCIGATFAMQEAIVALACIMGRVRLTPMRGVEPRPVLRITLKPDSRIPMQVHPA